MELRRSDASGRVRFGRSRRSMATPTAAASRPRLRRRSGGLVQLDEFAGVVVEDAAAEHGCVEGDELLVGDEREAIVRSAEAVGCDGWAARIVWMKACEGKLRDNSIVNGEAGCVCGCRSARTREL